jgi:hypothetical protein
MQKRGKDKSFKEMHREKRELVVSSKRRRGNGDGRYNSFRSSAAEE